jgi:hypothetical protein
LRHSHGQGACALHALLSSVTGQLRLLGVDRLLVAQVAAAKAPGPRQQHRRGLPDAQYDRGRRMGASSAAAAIAARDPSDPS